MAIPEATCRRHTRYQGLDQSVRSLQVHRPAATQRRCTGSRSDSIDTSAMRLAYELQSTSPEDVNPSREMVGRRLRNERLRGHGAPDVPADRSAASSALAPRA